MGEPQTCATETNPLGSDLRHWWIVDERIGGFRSEAYAVREDGGSPWVLVDPLPLAADALEALGPVAAIVMSSAAHQRSAWRLRRESGVPVHAPAGAEGLEEAPDATFADGDALPGGLRALAAPGPRPPHLVFESAQGENRTLFSSDLVIPSADGRLVLLPAEHLHDPVAARNSVRILAARRPTLLCLGHGPPVRERAAAALEEAADSHAGD